MDIYNSLLQILTVFCYSEFIAIVLLFCVKNRGLILAFANMTANILNKVDHYDIFVPNNPFLMLTSEPVNSIFREESVVVELVYAREDYRVAYQWHILVDTEDSKKYIGLIFEVVDSELNVVYCVDVIMNACSFFRFPVSLVKTHLLDIVCDSESDLPLMVASDLCRLVGDYGLMDIPSSPIVFKTLWISVIQRAWRRNYAERQRRLLLRGSLAAQRRFELCGDYGISIGRVLCESQQI